MPFLCFATTPSSPRLSHSASRRNEEGPADRAVGPVGDRKDLFPASPNRWAVSAGQRRPSVIPLTSCTRTQFVESHMQYGNITSRVINVLVDPATFASEVPT